MTKVSSCKEANNTPRILEVSSGREERVPLDDD